MLIRTVETPVVMKSGNLRQGDSTTNISRETPRELSRQLWGRLVSHIGMAGEDVEKEQTSEGHEDLLRHRDRRSLGARRSCMINIL